MIFRLITQFHLLKSKQQQFICHLNVSRPIKFFQSWLGQYYVSSVSKGCRQRFKNKRIKGQQLFCIPIAPVQAKYLRTYFYFVKYHQPKTIFDYQVQHCLLHDMVSITHKPRLISFRHRRSDLFIYFFRYRFTKYRNHHYVRSFSLSELHRVL